MLNCNIPGCTSPVYFKRLCTRFMRVPDVIKQIIREYLLEPLRRANSSYPGFVTYSITHKCYAHQFENPFRHMMCCNSISSDVLHFRTLCDSETSVLYTSRLRSIFNASGILAMTQYSSRSLYNTQPIAQRQSRVSRKPNMYLANKMLEKVKHYAFVPKVKYAKLNNVPKNKKYNIQQPK